jgi:AsmA protein
MKSPLLRLLASGNADLVKETLDFRIEPKVVGTIEGQGDTEQRSGVRVPVIVSGTFASPKFRPDMKAIAEQQFKEKVLKSEEAKKILEKPGVKKYEEPAKGILKGILGR